MDLMYFSMLRLPLADLKNSLTLFNEPQLCKRRGHELTTEPLKLLAAVYSIICPVDSISDTAKKHATKLIPIVVLIFDGDMSVRRIMMNMVKQ
ncbi:hypothetical protein HID58_014539 [Brassica napus]|uniref:Uncharacterized protein n=1 Tax=Brassica napus TaxID=3708 RepID=A0ABQ8DHF0_BRANA|nr:hypothetical protein HID58_014539 [Brassica napus]